MGCWTFDSLFDHATLHMLRILAIRSQEEVYLKHSSQHQPWRPTVPCKPECAQSFGLTASKKHKQQ